MFAFGGAVMLQDVPDKSEQKESGKLVIALLCLKGKSGSVPFPAFDPAIDGCK
jgi:hypothetical protein